MNWLQLTIYPKHPGQLETLETLLKLLGAHTITFEDNAETAIYEPDLGTTPLWPQTKLSCLFKDNSDIDKIIEFLNKQFETDLQYQSDLIAEQDWQKTLQENFHPMQFTENLWIVPSWSEPPNPDAINIRLDPGLAFGTGTHSTTRLCLQWLANHKLENLNVIDYGCGSGVLGIAALLLGAKKVWAVDIDPQAVHASRENANHNHIKDQQFEVLLPEDMPSIKADIIVANILANPLIELAKTFHQLSKPNTTIILSGILESQKEDVIQNYEQYFTFQAASQDENWVCLVFQTT